MQMQRAGSCTNASCGPGARRAHFKQVELRSRRHKPSLHRHVRFQLRDLERDLLSRQPLRGADARLLRRAAAWVGPDGSFYPTAPEDTLAKLGDGTPAEVRICQEAQPELPYRSRAL